MTSQQREPSILQLAAAYLFAHHHVRHMPRDSEAERLARATWCRDNCSTFAGRWFMLGVVAWFTQISPLGGLLSPGGTPVLAFFFLFAFAIGVYHTVWQIAAQQKAGLPPIEEPVDMKELRRPERAPETSDDEAHHSRYRHQE